MASSIQVVKSVFAAFFGRGGRRQDARHFLLSVVAGWSGYKVYNQHLVWPGDTEFLEVWTRFPKATPGITDRRYFLFSAARMARSIAGDTAECGSFRGAGSFLIASANAGTGKGHHIFDSFEGLSAPGTQDQVSPGSFAYSWQKNDLAVAELELRNNLRDLSGIHTYKGWIPERFGEVSDRSFSLVHIDVDLYQPTYDSLAFFYPRMTAGGLIICDDYGFSTCPGAKQAFDEFFSHQVETPIHLPTGQCVVVKR